MNKADQTRGRIAGVALHLFSEQGYDETTVAQIAAAAGVSHMTFFRYFPTKEDVVVSDPYDPLIAESVAAQPRHLRPVERVRQGLVDAWAAMNRELDLAEEQVTARIRLAAAHRGLRARTWDSNRATQQAIVAVLVEQGADPAEAEAATGACLGAITAALLADWSGRRLSEVVLGALAVLEPQP